MGCNKEFTINLSGSNVVDYTVAKKSFDFWLA